MSFRRRCSPRVAAIALSVWLLLALLIHLRDELTDPDTHATPVVADGDPASPPRLQGHAGTGTKNDGGVGRRRKNAFVVASQRTENTSWLREHFPGWELNIYAVDDPTATLTVPRNKGRESMVYLTYIIDHYDDLPDNILFIHPSRYQWHNDDPDYDGLPMLRRFQVQNLEKEGYVNLRCAWVLGCPVEIQPLEEEGHEREEVHAGAAYKQAFMELFPGKEVPKVVGVSCCAQFAATKETIRRRPKADYVAYRKWVLETPLEDAISGRVLEYSWHMIFGKNAVYCPSAAECYCNVFGLCSLNCPEEGECEGRYVLPPFSSLPDGWPLVGWDRQSRNRSAPEYDL